MLYSSSLRLLPCFGSFLCAFVFLELVHFSMCFDLLALCSISVPTVRWLVCSLTCLGLINQAVWFVFFIHSCYFGRCCYVISIDLVFSWFLLTTSVCSIELWFSLIF